MENDEKNAIELSTHPKLGPIKQYIEVMIEKQGYNQAVANIQNYIKTRNPSLVTRDYNLRSILSSYSQEDLVKGIETVNKLLKIDERYANSNQDISYNQPSPKPLTATDIIDISVTDTVQKLYKPTNPILFQKMKQKQINIGLNQIVDNNNYSAFTNTNNARSNMMKLNVDSICAELVKGTIIIYNSSDKGYFSNVNMPLVTENDAIAFIMGIVNNKGTSVAYQTISQFSHIRELLISSYANFISTTTKEDRDKLIDSLSPEAKSQLTSINNLQDFLINQAEKNYGGK